MLARLVKARDEHEEGFTLIELLVVIIIIGILAAIAIPVFLSQRQKGYDAGIKSDLRNAATSEESNLTDNGVYFGSQAGLPINAANVAATLGSEGFKFSNTTDYTTGTNLITAYWEDDAGAATSATNVAYCLSAISASGKTFVYDSSAGGLQPTGTTCK